MVALIYHKAHLDPSSKIPNQFYTTRSTVVILVTNLQNEFMIDIFPESLVRNIGKVLHMTFS